MVQSVYADVLFVIDFCMNFFSLYMTARILCLRAKTVFYIMSASLGALYDIVTLIYDGGRITGFLLDISVSALMCFIVFGKTRFFRTWISYFCVSALMSGLMFGMYYLMYNIRFDDDVSLAYPYSKMPIWLLTLLAVSGMLISKLSHMLNSARAKSGRAEIEIKMCGSVKINSIIDSGNFLTEPISGKPVIIADMGKIECILPPDIKAAVKRGDLSELGSDSMRRVRLVPMRGISESKIMTAFMPNRIFVDGREVDAYIAVAAGGENFCGADAIISPSLT